MRRPLQVARRLAIRSCRRTAIEGLRRRVAGSSGPPADAWPEYGTHAIPLAAAAYCTRGDGPILELGIGHYSTPILHLMCRDRLVVSAETKADWLARFRHFASPSHELHLVRDWRDWRALESRTWAVALVDSAPGEQRVDLIRRLKGRTRFIVVHDTETDHGTGAAYGNEPVFATFAHRSDYRLHRPYTTILSDDEPFELDPFESVWPLA